MTPQEMEKALRQTLADRRLSASERSALTAVLADAHLDGQKAAAHRATAFALAREAIDDPRARECRSQRRLVPRIAQMGRAHHGLVARRRPRSRSD